VRVYTYSQDTFYYAIVAYRLDRRPRLSHRAIQMTNKSHRSRIAYLYRKKGSIDIPVFSYSDYIDLRQTPE
jgi:hypothetical protein